ncbi:hypothetical protein TTHERM_00633380 (macronuclear) [Tetrahymena thermophila SB210]|uniref:Uncharacterized protein n=1 Tax=Tetrahymena thermophila (strain SB210) TaxID=312017 RepID=Q22X15_TETTS|nr:hypothetical protein TTHERM_00633380 [Tetrahymena thermophila SB210]EAR89831.1 hypothetical protein TTHERM_00633380 [Tetrahymena thermophila SB210]|eukprot:XP_001010076.1 hypothetical protein TTHERM_00633380 [Tetrahymena thermophila SB210]
MSSQQLLEEKTVDHFKGLSNITNTLHELLKCRPDISILISRLNQEYYKNDLLARPNLAHTVTQEDLDLIWSLYAKVVPYHLTSLSYWYDKAKKPMVFEEFKMFRRKILKLCYYHLQLCQFDKTLDIDTSTLNIIFQEFKKIM